VQVDVTDLEPLVQYWYRFNVGGVTSPVGTFRLQPEQGEKQDMVWCAGYKCNTTQRASLG
jgi:phosphodiesterase/alkaline phosphatase D-like protein